MTLARHRRDWRMSDPPTVPPSILAELRRRGRTVDWLAIGAVPAVLGWVFTLPLGTQTALVFDHGAPSLSTAFSTHYVHQDVAHLAGNLALYVLVVPTVYLLFLLADRRAEFAVVMVTVLFGFPIVLTTLGSFLYDRGTVLGFSGLAMAFVGVLPVAYFLYLEATTRVVGLDDSPALFLAGIGLIALLVVPSGVGLLVAVAAIALGLLYGVRILWAVGWPTATGSRWTVGWSGHVDLVVIAPAMVALALVVAFQATSAGSTHVVDSFGHLLGYSLGYLGTYLTVRLDRTLLGHDVPPPPPPDGEQGP